jgi:hypothetical protein
VIDQTNFQHGTYADGMAFVVAVVVAAFVTISLLDLVCAIKGWPSVGYRVRRWSRKNPFYVVGLLLVLMMLLVHIVGNHIMYSETHN